MVEYLADDVYVFSLFFLGAYQTGEMLKTSKAKFKLRSYFSFNCRKLSHEMSPAATFVHLMEIWLN